MDVVSVKQQNLLVTETQLAALYDQMLKHKDTIQAQKILDLYDKQHQQTISISFAGHFSAGKSSMINTLLNEDILPKSPIPTSANIVRLTSGEGVARIYFKHQQPVEYSEPYDIEQIKAYSKNKSDIKQIDISTSKPVIPENHYIIDTPGIDAADDADRVMTEGALHVVDHVFYVMDYNHVQSEVNLEFLKNLQDQLIPFSMIINQIDKHDYTELSFDDFQKNIEKTFTQWALLPEHIYYTSLTDPSNKLNELEEVKSKLYHLLNSKYDQVQNTVQSVTHVIQRHKQFLNDRFAEDIDGIHQQQSSTSEQDNMEALNEKISQLTNQPEDIERELTKELNHTLHNAYLMPAATRDHAELFLYATQSDFKVGLIGSKRKTDKERAARLYTFLNALQENMQTTIQWKLRDKLTTLLKKHQLNDETLIKEVQTIQIDYTEENILELVKSGAKVNGQYVLNFTNEVASDIKQQYKHQALKVITFIKDFVSEQSAKELQPLKQKYRILEKNRELDLQKKKLEQEMKEACSAVDAAARQTNRTHANFIQVEEALAHKKVSFLRQAGQTIQQVGATENAESTNSKTELPIAKPQGNIEHDIISHIKETTYLLDQTPGFSNFISDLKQKQDRLEKRSYTISLFGAFSAGKSTFANAMLGESVLPVSPNPTTATVNRINPVTDTHPHGSVVIRVKDEETLVNDLLMITKPFSPSNNQMVSLLEWVENNDIHHHDSLSKLYQSYLQAMLTGYQTIKHLIGKTIQVDVDEFPDYVADETKASFVESIDLYYDCSLTQQGITLVDTPGADSVNARHTNVAFDYIKEADAILYVTYYNHALSKADKTFLMQLGRVKEAFQLDKMFFIVNAADLAENEEEINLVTSYVEEQLTHLGIRLPRLYPVSSKQSLKEKRQGNTLNEKMYQFEQDFNSFIHHDLTALTVQSAVWDLKRTYAALLNYKASVNMDQSAKDSFKQTLETGFGQAKYEIDSLKTDIQIRQLTQRIEKQLYYVWERVSLRYHDLFKESFNPTTITSSGKEGRMELKQSLQALIDDIAYELLQELRAVSLRVEHTEQKLAKEVQQHLAFTCEQIHDVFTFPDFDPPEITTPEYEAAFKTIDLSQFNHALTVYKNTKSFFVDNQKEFMKEKIYEVLDPLAANYLETNRQVMTDAYLTEWSHNVEYIQEDLMKHLEDRISDQLEMMAAPVDMEDIDQKIASLNQILTHYELT